MVERADPVHDQRDGRPGRAKGPQRRSASDDRS